MLDIELPLNNIISDELKQKLTACFHNAKQHLTSSKILYSSHQYNHAFLHAIFSLEEIGKASLLVMEPILKKKGKEAWLNKKLDDHEQKLFYAFIMPELAIGNCNDWDFENAKKLAANYHEKRLKSCYVSNMNGEVIYKISEKESKKTIQLVEARIKFEDEFNELNTEKLLVMDDYIDLISHDSKCKFLVSKESLDQLSRIKNINLWVKWAKTEFAIREREMQKWLKNEIKRTCLDEIDKSKLKWKLTFRIQAISHHFKQSQMNWWNQEVKNINLNLAKNNNKELIINIKLSKDIYIASVSSISRTYKKLLILSFNIASLGFFWWYSPDKIYNFYEQIEDIENNKILLIKFLDIKWENKVLSKENLKNVGLCFYSIDQEYRMQREKPFEEYLKGLTFISKTDIYFNFNIHACFHFLEALKSAMKLHGDWDGQTNFFDSFKAFFTKILNNAEELTSLRDLFEKLLFNKINFFELSEITLDKTMQVKVLCDLYFLKFLRDHTQR